MEYIYVSDAFGIRCYYTHTLYNNFRPYIFIVYLKR